MHKKSGMNDDVVLEMTERKNPIIISKAVTDEYVPSLKKTIVVVFPNRVFSFLSNDSQKYSHTLSILFDVYVKLSLKICSNMCDFVD